VSYVVAQAGGETTNRLLFPLCHSPLPYVRTAAIRALNIEKDPDAKAAIVKALSDRSRAVQIEAAAKLLSSSDSTWGEQVIAAIPNKLKTREILQVVSRMSNCQSIPAASFLAWAASCPDFELRMQATDQIGRFPSHIGLAALAEQLKHEIWIGQEAILGALASGRRCEPGIVDVALLESRKSLDPTMEELWIAAAAGTANEDLRRQLQRTLTQSDNLGTEILGALGVPVNDHEEMLFAAQLASDSRTTRSAAAIGLVRSGSTSARSHLHSRDFILDLTMLMESATYEIGMGNPAAGEQLVGLLERQIALESRRGSVQLQSLKAEALGRFLRTVGALD